MARYRVLIEKMEEKTVVKNSYERVAESGNVRDKGPVYEYVPHNEIVNDRTTFLEQTVEEIDLKAVICAINGIPN